MVPLAPGQERGVDREQPPLVVLLAPVAAVPASRLVRESSVTLGIAAIDRGRRPGGPRQGRLDPVVAAAGRPAARGRPASSCRRGRPGGRATSASRTLATTRASTSSTRRTAPGSEPLAVQSARATANARLNAARRRGRGPLRAGRRRRTARRSSSPPAERVAGPVDEGDLVAVAPGELGERALVRLGGAEPAGQPQGHPRRARAGPRAPAAGRSHGRRRGRTASSAGGQGRPRPRASVAAASARANRRSRPSQASGVRRPRWASGAAWTSRSSSSARSRWPCGLRRARRGPGRRSRRAPARARVRPTSGGIGRLRWNRSSRAAAAWRAGSSARLGEDDLAGDGQGRARRGPRPHSTTSRIEPAAGPERRGQPAPGGVAEFGRGRQVAARAGPSAAQRSRPGRSGSRSSMPKAWWKIARQAVPASSTPAGTGA